MKKKVGLILVAVAMCAFTACSQESAQSKTGEKERKVSSTQALVKCHLQQKNWLKMRML